MLLLLLVFVVTFLEVLKYVLLFCFVYSLLLLRAVNTGVSRLSHLLAIKTLVAEAPPTLRAV